MIFLDVNVLIYAHRQDLPEHEVYRAWLEKTLTGEAAFGVPGEVASGFVRIVTNRRVFSAPTPLDDALRFVEILRQRPNFVAVRPGQRHWSIFVDLCLAARAVGNLVPDAYLAALAIEWGAEWVTTDGDFARFQGLRWRHPLRPSPRQG